jgi:hypothetical protein
MDKRRKELALLAVGALVVLIALFLTFRPRTQPAAAQPPAAPAQVAQPKPQPKLQAAKPGQAEPALVQSGAPTTTGRDPFRPVFIAQVGPVEGAPGSGSLAASAVFKPGVLPPFPISGFLGGSAPTAPGAAPVKAEEPLRLTGIVHGDPAVAVLRKGEKRFIVSIGDPVDNQYVVKSISDGRVVLASGEKRLSLTLGGRM